METPRAGCGGKRAEPQEPHAGRRACLGPSRALCGGGAIPTPAAVLMGLAQRPAAEAAGWAATQSQGGA